ncbi:unnamed protein product [Arctia plantaginis]|uniref:Uncharacterized protein n=1 Tax=Arctia plantaginis TaxID=874455 RepID=A0A8S1B326_ARCPL|nr:unnamed protein product [Arctia plantaginis]
MNQQFTGMSQRGFRGRGGYRPHYEEGYQNFNNNYGYNNNNAPPQNNNQPRGRGRPGRAAKNIVPISEWRILETNRVQAVMKRRANQ